MDGSILSSMTALTRRTLLSGISAASLAAPFVVRAQAIDFPDKPLRMVVGFPPGGPNDLLTRIIAPGIGERLGRNVVVENRAGANGEIAAASVAKTAPDGGVFMLGSNGSTTVAAALNKALPYDVRTDFVAVAPVGINPMLLVVRPDLPAKNVEELLKLSRDKPGKLNGASAGAGGATQGGGPAMADLMASMVDIYFGGLSTALPHVKSGKLRALGQTGARRSVAAPDIPTIAESGLPGYEAAISYGIYLPAGASPVLTTKLHDAVDATIRSPDVAKKFADLGADPQFGSPQEFAQYVADDLAKWTRVAKDAGLKAE
jgi:tripartite-type tricarboxylate transporter receptor subunit TctC